MERSIKNGNIQGRHTRHVISLKSLIRKINRKGVSTWTTMTTKTILYKLLVKHRLYLISKAFIDEGILAYGKEKISYERGYYWCF